MRVVFNYFFWNRRSVFFPQNSPKNAFSIRPAYEIYMKTSGVIMQNNVITNYHYYNHFLSKHLFSLYFFFLKVTVLKCLVYQMLYCFRHQSLLKWHQCYQSWNWVVPYPVPQIQAHWIRKINIIRHSSHQLIFTVDIGTSYMLTFYYYNFCRRMIKLF